MQVHDELVFEVQREAVEELIGRARELMSAAAQLRTSLKVDVGSGDELGRSSLITERKAFDAARIQFAVQLSPAFSAPRRPFFRHGDPLHA